MRTNIVIDDQLMHDSMQVTGARTKREAAEIGLRTLVEAGLAQHYSPGVPHLAGNVQPCSPQLGANTLAAVG